MKALIRHSITVYQALDKAAKDEVIDGDTYRIYRGHVSKLYHDTGVGQTYYTDVFDQLDRQGCITMMQRGGRNVQSVIVLHRPPTEEGYEPRRRRDLTSAEDFANMIEQVRKHNKLIGGIDIADALRKLEERVQRLEDNNRGARKN